jgi:hypothetical protein
MITAFKVSSDEKTVTWQHDGQAVRFDFRYSVFANHIEYLDEVIIHSNVQESGERNLAIYKADGSLKCQPAMPKLKLEVGGVYAVWFVQGKKQVTVVLHSDEYRPYDTACTFDLETCKFTKFHPTY